MITLPAASAPQAMRECVQKGVKGAVVITAGFAETGNKGRALQDEMAETARQGGLRFVGPNCMGIYSAVTNLNLALGHDTIPGDIGFISQSGTFGGIFARAAYRKGYGLSKFISVGNQADLEAADYLEYLAEDQSTKVIVMYIEGFKDGRKLFRVARETAGKKPVIVYKAGRNPSVARVAMSHTAAVAGEDRIFDAMCQQVGFIRAEELFSSLDMAAILTRQPLPKSNRVGILGTGGQCVVASDLCVSMGMEVPELRKEDTQFIISGVEFPRHAPPPRNPVDFAGSNRTSFMEVNVLNKMAQLDYIDGVFCNTPITFHHAAKANVAEQEKVDTAAAELISAIPQKFGKPVVTIGLSDSSYTGKIMGNALEKAGIPSYPTPEEAVRAMRTLVQYAEIKRKFADGQTGE